MQLQRTPLMRMRHTIIMIVKQLFKEHIFTKTVDGIKFDSISPSTFSVDITNVRDTINMNELHSKIENICNTLLKDTGYVLSFDSKTSDYEILYKLSNMSTTYKITCTIGYGYYLQ